ncbi:MAG: FAD-dependent oxidoreductase [Deltaproteobacteria bacterium]|nr:FAD-dependent oxidoreductase [Deltaproteobacteria bacterium]
MRQFKKLFNPGRIGSLEIRNRIVMNAMGTLLESADGSVSDRLIDYYEERAKGGAGLIVSCHTRVVPHPRREGFMGIAIWDDRFIPGWKKLSDRVHRHDAKFFIQLGHDGRQGRSVSKTGELERVAPSPVACPYVRETPRELSIEEIQEIIEQFVNSAFRAKEAGIDGVCLHAAHGYLLSQFISPSANKRSDRYGGTLGNRLRFPLEIIKAIRRKVGDDYPLIIRMNSFEPVPDGLTLEDSRVIASLLAREGLDAVDVSAGTYASMPFVLPPTEMRPGFNVIGAETIKRSVDVPVVANGRINDPLLADGMSRSFLADAEWPNKAKAGNLEDIRRCIGCCQGCVHPEGIFGGNPISCVINPAVGKEKETQIQPARKAKKVMVVGGGPAGLEAAMVAALRGHQVTLLEKKNRLGGQFILSAYAPYRQDNAMAISWLSRQAEKSGVRVEMGKEVTPELIEERKPDVVIIASGAVPILAGVSGGKRSNVVTAVDVLSGEVKVSGKIVIVGGGLVGCETADFLGERGCDVTIVEMLSEIAKDCPVTSKGFLLKRLAQYGVTVITSASLSAILDDGVMIRIGGKEEAIQEVDYVVLAMGMISVENLSNQVKDKKIELYVVGDAKEPRKITHAISEGAEIGRRI